MTSKSSKPDVRFEVTITGSRYGSGSEYTHFTARALIAGYDHDGTARLFGPDSYEMPFRSDNRAYAGLVITAQSDNDHMRTAGDEFYGWQVGYDRRGVIELADAEAMVKVLRVIDRGMTRLTNELGRPATLAQYATYAARALTTERAPFIRWVPEDRDIYGTGYQTMDPDALNQHIWSECAEWRKRHNVDAG